MSQLNNDDLRLLKISLDILEQGSILVESCRRIYEVCKCLYSIADTCLSSNTTMGQETNSPEISCATLALPEPLSGVGGLLENDLQSFLLSLQNGKHNYSDPVQMATALDCSVGGLSFGSWV